MIAANPPILVFSTGQIAIGQPPVARRLGVEDCHPVRRQAWFGQHLESRIQ